MSLFFKPFQEWDTWREAKRFRPTPYTELIMTNEEYQDFVNDDMQIKEIDSEIEALREKIEDLERQISDLENERLEIFLKRENFNKERIKAWNKTVSMFNERNSDHG